MKEDQSKESLQDTLAKKETEDRHFTFVIRQDDTESLATQKQTESADILSADTPNNKKWKWFQNNEWDVLIAQIIRDAGKPLTRDEITERLLTETMMTEKEVSNKELYIEQKIYRALKRDYLVSYKISGIRKVLYCLPDWLDADGNISAEMLQTFQHKK